MGPSDSEDSASSFEGADGKAAAVRPGNNAWVTAGIIIADVVGAGILSMANAVKHFGWLLGMLLIVALLAMNVHVSMLMWRAGMRHPEAHTYTDLVKAVFRDAPKVQRRVAILVTSAAQYTFIFSILGLYVLSFGKGLGMIFYDVQVCLPYWALVGCALILPFCLSARAMGTWTILIYLNVLTILGTITIPLVYMVVQGVEKTRPADSRYEAVASDLTFKGAMSGLSTFTFAFTSQFMLMEIMSEMRDRSELPKAYAGISAPFQLVAFTIVGLGGYYYLGSAVHGMIADNIPFGLAFRCAAGCLLVHMLIVYQIKGIVLCRAVHSALHPSSAEEDSRLAWTIWSALVLATCALAFLFSQLVPFFSDFVDLLGAMLAPLSCLVIPILAYLRSLWPTKGKQTADEDSSESTSEDSVDRNGGSIPGPQAVRGPRNRLVRIAEALLIATELLLAGVLTVFGTITAVQNISMNWGTYGYPFDCHCEGLWSTCECSGDHSGMEEICLANRTIA